MPDIKVKRPSNCGECARFYRATHEDKATGEKYDGYCDEFPVPLKASWICHPNIGVKTRAKKEGNAA